MSLSQREPVDETAPEAIDPLQAEIEALALRAETAEARVRVAAVEILKLLRLLRRICDVWHREQAWRRDPVYGALADAICDAEKYLTAGSESREAADAASPY